jgi:hypothetical protein
MARQFSPASTEKLYGERQKVGGRACLLWVSKIKSVRIRASKPFRAKACSVLSRPVPKLHLEVPAAIENAFDEHRVRRDDEGDCNAPLESGHSQSGQEIVALCTPQRKCREPVAEIDDAADIAVRALLTRMRRDVLVQAIDVALGKGREDNPHKVSLLLARGAARLDSP